MISAWAVEDGIVLGQVKTDEKQNEITAIPELIKHLELKGDVVLIDAMDCQKAIARQVVDKQADYGDHGRIEIRRYTTEWLQGKEQWAGLRALSKRFSSVKLKANLKFQPQACVCIPRTEISDQRRDWPKWNVLKLVRKLIVL